MKNIVKFFIPAAMLILLSACNLTTTNSLISNHGEAEEAYIDDVIVEFYAKESDALIERFSSKVSVTPRQLNYLYKLQDEDVKLDERKVVSRKNVTKNGTAYRVSVYNVPNSVGTEVVTITIVSPADECCELFGLNLNMDFDN